MENLIGNALKYTPEGGRVTVRAFSQDECLNFNVEDNGIGIPSEHLPRIFETFYRAKQAGSEGVEGRGLGLSLVKTIIERHRRRSVGREQSGQGQPLRVLDSGGVTLPINPATRGNTKVARGGVKPLIFYPAAPVMMPRMMIPISSRIPRYSCPSPGVCARSSRQRRRTAATAARRVRRRGGRPHRGVRR